MKPEFENNCGNKDLLVTYLYNEASPPERAEFERHLVICGACHNELQAFQGLREELSTWQMPFVPHIEVVTSRTAVDALREFFRLVPGWLKLSSGFATAAAAALVIFALTGTRISVGKSGFDAKFGGKEITQVTGGTATSATPINVNPLSRAEAEQMIQAAVAQVQAQAQQQTQLQLASLETKLNVAHQAQLQTATARIRQEQQRKLQIEMAKFDNGPRQTVTEWLLTATDASQEATNNEKNN